MRREMRSCQELAHRSAIPPSVTFYSHPSLSDLRPISGSSRSLRWNSSAVNGGNISPSLRPGPRSFAWATSSASAGLVSTNRPSMSLGVADRPRGHQRPIEQPLITLYALRGGIWHGVSVMGGPGQAADRPLTLPNSCVRLDVR